MGNKESELKVLANLVSRIRGNVDLIKDGKGGYLRDVTDVTGFSECKSNHQPDLLSLTKTPLPNIEKYKFEIILCDDFRIIKQPDKDPIISKGMINYRVIKNENPGEMQSKNTTIKHFYDVNYSKSDKSKSPNYLNSIIDLKTGEPICNLL